MSRYFSRALGLALALILGATNVLDASNAYAQSYADTYITAQELGAPPAQTAVYRPDFVEQPQQTTQQTFGGQQSASDMARAALPPGIMLTDQSGRDHYVSGASAYQHNLSMGMSPEQAQLDVMQAARYNAVTCQKMYNDGEARHSHAKWWRRGFEVIGIVGAGFLGGWGYAGVVAASAGANEANSVAWDADSHAWNGDRGAFCRSQVDYYIQHDMWDSFTGPTAP